MAKVRPTLYWLHTHFLMSTGGTRFVFEVVKQLSRNYRIVVIVEKSSKEWTERYHEIGVKVIEISGHSSDSKLYWLCFPYFFIRNLMVLRRLLPKDSVVISTLFPMHTHSVLLSKKALCYCFEPFAPFYDQTFSASYPLPQRLMMTLLAQIYSPIDRYGILRSRCLLTINPSVGGWIKKIYGRAPDGVSLLGVDVGHFKQDRRLKRERHGNLVIFHSTDFTFLKGTEYLLNALPMVVSRIPTLKIIISETASNEAKKKDWIEQLNRQGTGKNVIFMGHVPYQKLPELYSQADVYCFTGSPDSEGASAASLSVLEASSMGLPVIRSIGNRDEVLDGKTGVLVDPRNPKQLANAIIKLARNRSLRSKMGKMGQKHVERHYTWKHVGIVFRSFIEKLEAN